MRTQNKIYLGLIFVALTILTAFLVKWNFLTYEDIKFAATVIIALIYAFYEHFGKVEAKTESKRKDVEIRLLKNRVETLQKSR